MKRERIRKRIQREQLYYVPPFAGLYENWSKKWINRQYWRVAAILGSKEDALQQCAEVYIRCRNKYGCQPIDPSHFMALYKTSIFNEWARLSTKDSLDREHIELSDIEPTEVEYSSGPLAANYAKASWELKYVLSIIAEAPAETLRVMFAMASMKDLNRRVISMCGLKTRKNILKELKQICDI